MTDSKARKRHESGRHRGCPLHGVRVATPEGNEARFTVLPPALKGVMEVLTPYTAPFQEAPVRIIYGENDRA